MKRVGILSAALAIGVTWMLVSRQDPGCPAYVALPEKVLIAHAGGGLPDATYTNSIAAMDLAVQHGFRLVEIDMRTVGDDIILSHGRPHGGELDAHALFAWMKHNPQVLIVTDFKTDNVEGLTRLARMAGPITGRFVPQIYNPSEYGPVRRLGMRPPILTLYKVSERWRDFANSAELTAVTMPEDKRDWAKGLRKPVFLHTVNEPKPYRVVGFYTDCLVPRT